jgi:hypothetical protein
VKDTRTQAIAPHRRTAIFAGRDLITNSPNDPRAARAVEEAVSKSRFLVEVMERMLANP